jgi:hypothetical protein
MGEVLVSSDITFVLDDGSTLVAPRELFDGHAFSHAVSSVRLEGIARHNARLMLACFGGEAFPLVTHDQALDFLIEVEPFDLGERLYDGCCDVTRALDHPSHAFLTSLSLEHLDVIVCAYSGHGAHVTPAQVYYLPEYARVLLTTDDVDSDLAMHAIQRLQHFGEHGLALDVLFDWCAKHCDETEVAWQVIGALDIEHESIVLGLLSRSGLRHGCSALGDLVRCCETSRAVVLARGRPRRHSAS